jgi:threonine/homoserine/homoserine lactone efflux protein
MVDLGHSLGIDNLTLFILAGWLLNLTPGPDVLFIVANGARSTRAGVVAALGITAGCFVHIVAAAVGVSALIAASATAFMVLKGLGAAYLVYMGLAMLRSRNSYATEKIANSSITTRTRSLGGMAFCADQRGACAAGGGHEAECHAVQVPERHITSESLRKVFRQGFWTNALNPKVALFFLAFLPQFIAPDAAHPTLTFALLGLIFNVNAIPVNVGYALLASWGSRRASGLKQFAVWLERGAGALFVYFGIKLALSGNHA